MKRDALCWSPQGLGLSRGGQNFIMFTLEHGTGRQRYAQFEPVPNDALECRPFLCANERDAGRGAESVVRAVPRILATGFRIDLPSRAFSNRRPRLNPGFFCDVAQREPAFAGRP